MYTKKSFFIPEDYDDGILAGLGISGSSLITFYPDGKIETIETKLDKGLIGFHVLKTNCGNLIIFGYEDDRYEYKISVYNSGKLKDTFLGTKK